MEAETPNGQLSGPHGPLAAKLALPWQGYVLRRPRLQGAALHLRHGGLVTLVAGPGFGKTALLADMVRSHQGPSAYYALDESDAEASVLLRGLFAAIGQIDPEAAQVALDWLQCSGGSPGDLQDVVVALAARLGSFGHDSSHGAALLALDGVHELGQSSEAAACLRLLIEGLPPGWLCVLASRAPVMLDLTALQAQGRALQIDSRRLRLTPVEVRTWAREAWGLELQLAEARAVWRLTEGWPVALVLMGEQIRRAGRGSERSWITALMRKGTGLTKYLEEKIFRTLETEVDGLFMAAWPLRRVEFPRDTAFLPAGSEAVLESLAERGFLVTKTGGRIFTLHPLVRAFAEREAVHRNPEEAQRRRGQAAHHLTACGLYREAVSLYLRSGDLQGAAAPLRELAMKALNASAPNFEHEWLQLLPEELVISDPWLLGVRARLLQSQGSYEEARSLYRSAGRRFADEGDTSGQLLAVLGEALCAYVLGRREESLDILGGGEKLAKAPAERAEVFCNMATVLLSLCRWDEAAERLELASTQVSAQDRLVLEPRLDIYRTQLFYLRGQYRVAARWAARGVKKSSQVGQEMYATALNASATVHVQLGEYEQALLQGEAALAMVAARRWVFMEAPVHLCVAEVQLGLGMRREGLSHVKAALEVARRTHDVEVEVWAEDLLGDLCRRTHSPRKAQDHHRRALELSKDANLSSFELARSVCGLGMDLAAEGNYEAASHQLAQATGLARQNGLLAVLAMARLYEGWILACSGQEQAAQRALSEFGRLAEEGGYLHLLAQEADVALPIYALCRRYDVASFLASSVIPLFPTKLRNLYEELARGATYPTDVCLGAAPRRGASARSRSSAVRALGPEEEVAAARVAQLTSRELEILRLIGLGLPNKLIASRLFIAEKTVKTHTNRMFRKLGVTNRLQAVLALQAYERQQIAVRGSL